jgi:hypothetical protein
MLRFVNGVVNVVVVVGYVIDSIDSIVSWVTKSKEV